MFLFYTILALKVFFQPIFYMQSKSRMRATVAYLKIFVLDFFCHKVKTELTITSEQQPPVHNDHYLEVLFGTLII
jgi:hypothetical protein